MFSARKLLVAYDCAPMLPLGVPCAPEFFFDTTANLSALMFLTIFDFVANFLTLESLDHADLLQTHKFFFFVHRIVNLVTR